MPESNVLTPTPKEIATLVRNALAHLYDIAYLQTHPLGTLVDTLENVDDVTRAQRLRKALLSCIEALRPMDSSGRTASAARAYVILTYRYIDDLSMDDIAGKLGLSRRQVYREHERGIDAVVTLMADRYPRIAQWHAATQPSEIDVIDLASAEVGRLKKMARIEAISLTEVLENIAQMFASLTKQVDIQQPVVPQGESDLVFADRLFLRQALINLMTHAMDISQDVIRCTVSRDSDASSMMIRLSVPLVPESAGSADGRDAIDVDMAVSHALIEAQKGELQIESLKKSSQWSACIVLPAAARLECVLVIDDNADFVELFRRYLGAYPVTVLLITDSQQVLRTCIEAQPSLITLDLMMSNLDGWDILQQLKRTPQTSHIPVVVCSVLNEARLAISLGASGYLTKPVDQSDFIAILRQWIQALQPSKQVGLRQIDQQRP